MNEKSDNTDVKKINKCKNGYATYGATSSLKDEEGKPLLWTLVPITNKEYKDIFAKCCEEILVGEDNKPINRLNESKFRSSLICASVVEPNLNDSELQKSYGVNSPDELVKEMVSNCYEYAELIKFIFALSKLYNMDVEEEL